jgi:hypothetical protein
MRVDFEFVTDHRLIGLVEIVRCRPLNCGQNRCDDVSLLVNKQVVDVFPNAASAKRMAFEMIERKERRKNVR